MDRGVFYDTGEGNEWARALGHFPWKSTDGVLFRNLMSFPTAFEQPLQLSEDGGQLLPAFAPDALSFHDNGDNDATR